MSDSDLAFPRESRCTSCRAAIVWLRTVNGNRMPVDAATVKPDDTEYNGKAGHVSHFATCPDAAKHRRPR